MAFERNRFFDLRRGIILVQAYVYGVNNLYKLNPEILTFSTIQRVSCCYKIPYIFCYVVPISSKKLEKSDWNRTSKKRKL